MYKVSTLQRGVSKTALICFNVGFTNPSILFPDCPVKPTTPTKISEEGDDVLGDYTIGERVWVNGVKPGVIAYLGETQFAPGQWAGVILNDLVGKNDGSVGGVRYFECQPLQGIFTRPSKLTRQPVGEGSDSHSTDSLSTQNQNQGGGCAPSGQRVVVPLREGLLNSAVKTGNESGSNMSDSGSVKKGGDKDLRVGDRVLVSNRQRRNTQDRSDFQDSYPYIIGLDISLCLESQC